VTVVPDGEIVKTADKTIVKSGEIVTYTLTINVTGGTISQVEVQDILPAHMIFVSFGSVPDGGAAVYTPTNTLKWDWQTLGNGTHTVTYQAQVDDYVQEGMVLTNNAQMSYLGMTGTRKTSVSVQLQALYTVKVGIYNEAGELVKEIWVKQLSDKVTAFDLSSGTISGLNTPVTVLVGGKEVAVWDGTAGSGDPVSNGKYYVKVDSVDAYGSVTSVSQTVMVNRALAKVEVNVYNEAGEVVRHITEYAQDANDSQLTGMELSTNVVSSDASGSGGNPNQVVVTLNTGVTFVWDGRNDAGAVVTSGHYELEVHWTNGKGSEDVVSRGILVRNDQGGMSGKAYAGPNVVGVKENYKTTFRVDGVGNITLRVRVYNMAGELVAGPLDGVPGTGKADWDGSGKASGLYLGVVEVRDAATGHFMGRQTAKVLLMK